MIIKLAGINLNRVIKPPWLFVLGRGYNSFGKLKKNSHSDVISKSIIKYFS